MLRRSKGQKGLISHDAVDVAQPLCWQWITMGPHDHATGLPMRSLRGKGAERNPLVVTVSARKVHGRTAHYGWRTAVPSSWEDYNPAACNVLAELWLTNLLREQGIQPVSLIAGVYRRITPSIVDRLVENLPEYRREPIATALLRDRRQMKWRVNTQNTGMTVNCLNGSEAACVTRRLHGYVRRRSRDATL
ncbi:hypothetical protein BCV69DRAFT_41681 [Microstroma glucosiphilum]|uniref:Uncharacterized protein n=1 Tax=Pseudomicrostroma glucosiphilum TaxID=1684307 RepID=A0A316U2D4_9BASI|nr:hypothetical protein BCV69DRAFT_41681 [Pseudomicrostroma glucosiphilum]PWN19502.1 hypothetical protein BCV69DRAFT_41681 [Pseudomicrostroma glucosiphilum]